MSNYFITSQKMNKLYIRLKNQFEISVRIFLTFDIKFIRDMFYMPIIYS